MEVHRGKSQAEKIKKIKNAFDIKISDCFINFWYNSYRLRKSNSRLCWLHLLCDVFHSETGLMSRTREPDLDRVCSELSSLLVSFTQKNAS